MEKQYMIDKALQIIYELGKSAIDGFELRENDLRIYRNLIMYFHEDPEFEKLNPNYKLSKGIFLHGNIGTGKSKLFEIFNLYCRKYLPPKNFHIVKTNDITDNFYFHGLTAIQTHGILSFKRNVDNLPSFDRPLTKCYDDLGVEPKIVKSYGNERNVMADILLKRYDLFTLYGMKTYMTTNYNVDDVIKNYGNRVGSRFKEMCNDIVYEGKDRRR